MSRRRIRLLSEDDPILRQVAKPLDVSLGPWVDFRFLVEDMIAVMRGTKAVGIAAPQIGYSVRVIVVKREPEKSWDEDDRYWILVNPELKHRPAFVMTRAEGCLSIPDKIAYVTRRDPVLCEAYDHNFREISIMCHGLLAIVLQHEVDHLNGTLMTDLDVGPGMNNVGDLLMQPPPEDK